jgi:hypothetical protein
MQILCLKTNEMILVLNEKDHINSVFPKLNVVRMKNTKFCENAELVGEVALYEHL